jgi:hypothetical protein
MSIRFHGQQYLRPPGLEPLRPQGEIDHEQTTPAAVDETFIQDEDEEGFVLSDDEEDGDDYEDEELDDEEEEQVSPSIFN